MTLTMTDQSSLPIGPRVIVALDLASADAALEMARRLDPRRCRVKVGKELFTTGGPLLVARLRAMGFEVFVDLKFHDIPNTVAAACRAAASDGAWMLDVHASGGRRMMEAAREALAPFSPRPLLVAVTVLTSMDARDLAEVGVTALEADPHALVEALASSQMAVETIATLRDRVVEAYQEILRMPI